MGRNPEKKENKDYNLVKRCLCSQWLIPFQHVIPELKTTMQENENENAPELPCAKPFILK